MRIPLPLVLLKPSASIEKGRELTVSFYVLIPMPRVWGTRYVKFFSSGCRSTFWSVDGEDMKECPWWFRFLFLLPIIPTKKEEEKEVIAITALVEVREREIA